jgi:hypothetical protein
MNRLIDVRDILSAIHVPTLVLHRSGDRAVAIEHGRYIADHIESAKFVELPGNDHLWWVGNSELIVDEVQEFLTGERPALETDRVLATVLFTDIVGSTRRAIELGDRRWRDLLDTHNSIMQADIQRFRGRVVKSTGDGVLATLMGQRVRYIVPVLPQGMFDDLGSRSVRDCIREKSNSLPVTSAG